MDNNDSSVKFLNIGFDLKFCSNLKKALNMINYEYIIYLQDDYFFSNIVNTSSIEDHLKHCIKNNLDFLKIDHYTNTRDNFRINSSDYCLNPIDAKYSIDTSASIWNKNTLTKLCIDGWDGWDFERKIITHISKNKIVLKSEILHSSVYPEKGIKYVHSTAVCRGRWTQSGVQYLHENGFDYLISNRPIQGVITTFLLTLYKPNKLLYMPISIIIKIFQWFNL